MYLTTDFYTDEYAGVEIKGEKLTALIKRAERDIDRMTNFRIIDFDNQPSEIKTLVRNAVSSQVEFLNEKGETASSFSNDGAFSIGSYSEGSRQTKNAEDTPKLSAAAYDFLYPTGYLYAGVDYY